MAALTPFRAWHPATDSNASPLICPVYDTIGAEELVRFSTLPHNAARFVPRPANQSVSEFVRTATAEIRSAIRDGAFVRDAEPGYYVYGIRYVPDADILETIPVRERRSAYLLLGLLGKIDFDRSTASDLALHERVFEDRVEERIALTDATGFQYAPIMAGYSTGGHTLNDRLEAILDIDRRKLSFQGAYKPLFAASIGETTHVLWRISEESQTRELTSVVEKLRLLVFDGHHRYTAASRRHSSGKAASPLMMLVDGHDRALRLMPWHRALGREDLSFERWITRAREEFQSVESLGKELSIEETIQTLHDMTEGGQRGFLAFGRPGGFRVVGPANPDVGADFDLLHGSLENRWGIDPVRFAFHRSPRRALEAIRDPRGTRAGGSAFLLPDLHLERLELRAFDSRVPMAQKSTMFLPKVAEGVVFAAADRE